MVAFVLKQSIVKGDSQLLFFALLIKQSEKWDIIKMLWRGSVVLSHDVLDVVEGGAEFREFEVSEEILGFALGLLDAIGLLCYMF